MSQKLQTCCVDTAPRELTGNPVPTSICPITQDTRFGPNPDAVGEAFPGSSGAGQSTAGAEVKPSAGHLVLSKIQCDVPLTEDEQVRFDQYERDIRQYRGTMLRASVALKAIRDERLYRGEFDSFEGAGGCPVRPGQRSQQAQSAQAQESGVALPADELFRLHRLIGRCIVMRTGATGVPEHN